MRSPKAERLKELLTPNFKTAMFKRESWKLIIQVVISILTAIATTLGVTSCL